MTTPYIDLFSDWKDVQSNFTTDEKEPDEVIFAAYKYEDYSGDAVVAYRNGETYYLNEGSHCSCYGLEDQWQPEAYTKEQFIQALQKRTSEWPKEILARVQPKEPTP